MFTGIITDLGEILAINDKEDGREFVVSTSFDISDVPVGASIAIDGACMTMTNLEEGKLAFYASHESLGKTVMGEYKLGDKVNLERAARFNDFIDGHLVSGHIDDVTKIKDVLQQGDSYNISFYLDPEYRKFVIEKGSVAISGVSLTINKISADSFTVCVIPHTYKNTKFSKLKAEDKVNIEFDMIGKYLLNK